MTNTILAALIGAFLALVDAKPPDAIYPEKALAFAREHGLTEGRVYNDYDAGGFLILNGVPTFIDGRGVPFGDMMQDYFFPSGERLQAALDRYNVSWALVIPGSPKAKWFDEHWTKLYADEWWAVYAKP